LSVPCISTVLQLKSTMEPLGASSEAPGGMTICAAAGAHKHKAMAQPAKRREIFRCIGFSLVDQANAAPQ
jgi:hypothetical protein